MRLLAGLEGTEAEFEADFSSCPGRRVLTYCIAFSTSGFLDDVAGIGGSYGERSASGENMSELRA